MADVVDEFSRFAQIFPDALLLVSATGNVRTQNPAAKRLLGRDFDHPCCLTEVVADPAHKVEDFLRLCARSREKLPATLTFLGAEGAQPFHCDGWGAGLRDELDAALVVIRVVPKAQSVQRFAALNSRIEQLGREIGKRMQAERAAGERGELLHVTLRSIGDAVITTDTSGLVTFMNPVAERLTGWAQSAASGAPLERIFVIRNEETGTAVENPVAKVLRDGVVVGLANHTVLVRRDGTTLPIDDSGAPIRDENGDLIGVVMVFHEISEQRRLERELQQQALALREADQRKDRFLAMLGHELRNPLAPLRNAVQVLKVNGKHEDVLGRMIDMMERQIAQLTRLVDDLLDIARITRGAIELERRPVSLAAVLDHALETVMPFVEERSHAVTVTTTATRDLIVDGDFVRLSQVFCNLLNNAAKFMDPGGEIAITSSEHGECAVVVVKDQGRGMAPELARDVFDLFIQEDRSLDRREGGLGIGLTLVRSLVEMHGGRVTAASEGPGSGSEFSVALPLASSAESAGTAGSSEWPQVEADVLVVDDNVDAAVSLAMLLELFGCRTRTAYDGDQAIQSVEAKRPDLILLDIGLPGMDGFKVATRLRAMPASEGMRIVALTGYGSELDRLRSKQAGFDDHLTKPVDLETLKNLLLEHPEPERR